MTPIEQFRELSPKAKEIVHAYARRRGVKAHQLKDYLQPALNLDGSTLPQIDRFIERLGAAIQRKEQIVIFGDYDADGITATAILLRCLDETIGVTPGWALPNRQHDHYGLGLEKAKEIYAQHRPSLLVCLDCGTNSVEAVSWLKQRHVDTLVVDHHPVDGNRADAVAMINPVAHEADNSDCCAAGLTLLLCQELANAWNRRNQWNRDTAVALAGIATLADAVGMTQFNRALIKNAMQMMNDSEVIANIPGLSTLLAGNARTADQRHLQFDLIPRLNAPGRLGDAEPVVTLLTTHDLGAANAIAKLCVERNELRKHLQREMVGQAQALAAVVVKHQPQAAVIVLAEKSWHHGVAGPAASRIAETFQRSAILLAPYGQEWKGSGRSAHGDHLGKWIQHAKSLGVLARGGGHAAAVGLAVTAAQLAPLQSAGLFLEIAQTDSEPETEIIGEIDNLPVREWATVIALLGPFGRGNPFPCIAARQARLIDEPLPLHSKDSQEPWAMKGRFEAGSGMLFSAIWSDVEKAAEQWEPDTRHNLELELTCRRYGGKTYHNWAVRACR